MQPSAQLASELVEKLSEGFQLKAGERYGLLINGLGSTPLMEQYVFAMMWQNYSMKKVLSWHLRKLETI